MLDETRLGFLTDFGRLPPRLPHAVSLQRVPQLHQERTPVRHGVCSPAPSALYAVCRARTNVRAHVPQFWTPHSGRTFLPSATAALGIDKSERDYLGGLVSTGQRHVCKSKTSHQKLAEVSSQGTPTPVKRPSRRRRNFGSIGRIPHGTSSPTSSSVSIPGHNQF